MKAIQVHEFGGPEVLKVGEVATPTPGAGEVLVRVHAAGVNPPLSRRCRIRPDPMPPALWKRWARE